MERTFLAGITCGCVPQVDRLWVPVAISVSTNCRTSVLFESILAPVPLTNSFEAGAVGAVTPATLVIVGGLAGGLVIFGQPVAGSWLSTTPGVEAFGL